MQITTFLLMSVASLCRARIIPYAPSTSNYLPPHYSSASLAFVPSLATVNGRRKRFLVPQIVELKTPFESCQCGHKRGLRLSSTEDDNSNLDEIETDIPTPPTDQSNDPPSRYSSTFGSLLPVAKAVDDATQGWALSYADLHPATPRTAVGQAFLATNFCYAAAGLALGVRGEWLLGGLTEMAGIVSFWYHYSQLEFGKNRSEVRLALLIDYFTAGSALITGGVYMIQAGVDSIPLEAIGVAGGAVACLTLCWVWEFGYPYVFWHSLWHILSAYTGYLIGQEHISKMTGG